MDKTDYITPPITQNLDKTAFNLRLARVIALLESVPAVYPRKQNPERTEKSA